MRGFEVIEGVGGGGGGAPEAKKAGLKKVECP